MSDSVHSATQCMSKCSRVKIRLNKSCEFVRNVLNRRSMSRRVRSTGAGEGEVAEKERNKEVKGAGKKGKEEKMEEKGEEK